MYVCIYMCMYVCMYIYVYVCMYVYICVCIYMCMYICMYIYVYVCIYTMYVRMYGWMDEWMDMNTLNYLQTFEINSK